MTCMNHVARRFDRRLTAMTVAALAAAPAGLCTAHPVPPIDVVIIAERSAGGDLGTHETFDDLASALGTRLRGEVSTGVSILAVDLGVARRLDDLIDATPRGWSLAIESGATVEPYDRNPSYDRPSNHRFVYAMAGQPSNVEPSEDSLIHVLRRRGLHTSNAGWDGGASPSVDDLLPSRDMPSLDTSLQAIIDAADEGAIAIVIRRHASDTRGSLDLAMRYAESRRVPVFTTDAGGSGPDTGNEPSFDGVTAQQQPMDDATEDDPGGPVDCAADLDGDGMVGALDLMFLLAEWGRCDACDADIAGRAVVDIEDLIALIAAWGDCG